jgi:CP family cyanate transporter-like MFS transporter
LASAVFMNGLLMGEVVGAGRTLPVLLPLLDHSWRATLAAWSLPALAVAVALAWHRPSLRNAVDALEPASRPPWRDGRTWRLGLLLGSASAGFFGSNAYMGPVLEEAGRFHALPGMLLAFNATQVVGSLLMIVLARWLVGRRLPVVVAAAGLCLGLVGFAFGGPWTFLPAVLLIGLCTCVQLVLMVSLVPHLAGAGSAGSLAAGMFAVGYLLGFLVPLAGGVLADAGGSARLALLPLGLLGAAALAVALTPGLVHGAASINATGGSDVR